MKRFFNITNISIVGFIIFIITFIISKDYIGNNTNYNYKFFMISVTLITLFPILYYLNKDKEKEFFPLFEMSLIYFFISYALFHIFDHLGISFSIPTYSTRLEMEDAIVFGSGQLKLVSGATRPDIGYSFKVLFIGLISFIIGYFLLKYFTTNIQRNGFKFLNITDKSEMLFICLVINIITLSIFYIFKIQEVIPAISQLNSVFTFLLLSFNFFAVIYYKELKIYNKILLLLPIIFILIFKLLEGSYAAPISGLIYLYIIFFLIKKKLALLPILAIVIIFFSIHTFKNEFRANTWRIITKDDGIVEKLDVFKDIYKANYYYFFNFKNQENKLKMLKEKNLQRIFHSAESLVVVTRLSPEEVPYWKGESYKILASKIIPRIFWEDKPSDLLGNAFGKRYGILKDEDKVTSWNMPVLNEFYVNYGIKGVIIGMFVLGIFYRFLTIYLSIRNKNNYEFLIGAMTIFPLFFLESHLSLIFGAVLQTYIFLLFFIYFVKKIYDLTILKK